MKQLEFFKETDKNQELLENAFDWAKEFPKLCDKEGNFEGFDIVIGNPPYIPINKLPELKAIKKNYKTYKQTGDIYILFIERAIQILKKGGMLSYITSNKWMRAAYGENLRKFLLENTTVDKIIDFDGLKVFDEATVDTSIISLYNKKNGNNNIEAVRFDKTFNLKKDSISKYFDENKIKLSGLTSDSWAFLSEKEKQIKNKLITKGKILKNRNIKINRGIQTGLNEAFIITNKIRNEILDNCKTKKERQNTNNLLKNILRGRDIKKYYSLESDLYLINITKGFNKQSIKNKKGNMWDIFKGNYPSLASHLIKFKQKAELRQDKGDFWWELRACSYNHIFKKERLVWTDIAIEPLFTIITNNYYVNNTIYMISGKKIKYLLGILNSQLVKWYFPLIATGLGAKGYRFFKIFVEKIPIPEITVDNQETVNRIENLVKKIIIAKGRNKNVNITKQQTEIDKLVYKLYELSKEEIKMIEK